jgi:hypothetical protein
LGGTDVCDLLDLQPNAKRAFPQLLSLRDFTLLLDEIVNKDLIERSRAAIDEAKDLLPTFVPVLAYQKAFETVRKHNFAVLEGPPEMGKTAIARVLSMAQLLSGWEVIECRGPDDFFRAYASTRRQLFIADDAFGRTEYEPDRVSKWEQDLGRILLRLENRHWLLWTSRKHILERALRQMDLQGKADKFPKPGEVLVDASFLTISEKALILYRHAKAAKLDRPVRKLITENARLIVNQPTFTPERIRRFVKEEATSMTSIKTKDAKGRAQLTALIQQAIQNPTKRMRLSYEKLEVAQKWLLVSLLEAGSDSNTAKLLTLFQKFYPAANDDVFDQIVDVLTEAFLRLQKVKDWVLTSGKMALQDVTQIEWIHPSYRDLVIEELSTQSSFRERFLEKAGLRGIKLAISDTGGASGNRKFPLIRSDEDWELFRSRCMSLVAQTDNEETTELLDVLSRAREVAGSETKDRVAAILSGVCGVIKEKWDEGSRFSVTALKSFCRGSIVASILAPLPKLDQCWQRCLSDLVNSLDSDSLVLLENPENLLNWVDLVETILANEPRFLERIRFQQITTELAREICRQIASEINADIEDDAITDTAANASVVSEQMEKLIELARLDRKDWQDVLDQLARRARVLEARSEELELARQEQEPDEDDSWEDEVSLEINVEDLFRDL